MRLLQISVPAGKLQAVRSILDEHDIAYVVTEETSGREIEAIVSFPLPAEAVEPVLEDLRSAGLERGGYTVISDANTVISEQYDELEDEWTEEIDEEKIAREELHQRAKDLIPGRMTFFTMSTVSAVVATAGILMDSAAVVVGSMVIAPLIGPALAASVGTVLDDAELFRTGVWWQLIGVTLAVASATAFALLVRHVYLIPPGTVITDIAQVQERLAPNFLALAIALGAGVAGALSLSTGVSAALVGVMIAVALIPPAAVVGIGIAWGMPGVVLAASILMILNVLAINLAALGVFWYRGYRPSRWFRIDVVKTQTLRHILVLGVAILAISLFLGAVTVASFQASTQEATIEDTIHAVIDEPDHAHLEVLSIEIERDDRPLFAQPERVQITVTRPTDTATTPVADRIAAALAERTDRAIAVEVLHVEHERSG